MHILRILFGHETLQNRTEQNRQYNIKNASELFSVATKNEIKSKTYTTISVSTLYLYIYSLKN